MSGYNDARKPNNRFTIETTVPKEAGLCSRVRLDPRKAVCCGDRIFEVVDGKNTCCGDKPYNPSISDCCPNRGIVRKGRL